MMNAIRSGYMDRTFSELVSDEPEIVAPLRILPDATVLKIGGQSLMDRGREAMMPLLDEIVALKDSGEQMILGTGGGTRARHIYALALDLELPTGVLAALGAATPRQNAWVLQMVLAKHGAVNVVFEDFEKLPLYFRLGCLPIMSGMPPFEYWEKPAVGGRIPAHRTDAGVYLTAEFIGARQCLFVKDEDGLYTADPKKDRSARFIPKISVDELLELDLGDLILERPVLEYLKRARYIRQVQVFNGLVPGNLTRAMHGEHVGTVITAD